ncbi:phosphogluconate dehydrogenase [Enterococcus faecium]|nr:phosphogluconate dehydrogenase [Enterococcus faecium]EGP5266671.1 phosphogluconate dehydrogenase [Enterococcus faecium]EGP5330800.1 phosphogluconate dehydrogenase [Enterococcus faecium]EGP5366193.1 phosphogluconate dehydrogenase [Enterococcus faecium]EGP5371522.1 phosphogluconate dehydrogenase [Enterococcus faecium]
MRIPPFHNKIIIFSVLINVKDTRRVEKNQTKNIFLKSIYKKIFFCIMRI